MPSLATSPRPSLLRGTLSECRRVLARHYARLGPRSRQRRFMANLPDRTVRKIADRASPDIVLGIEAEDRIIGVLEVFRTQDAHAEIGISVEDAYQGHGYGYALFLDGLVEAEKIGVRTADLYFSCDNSGIRHLVTRAGGRIINRGAECEAHIDIPRCAECHVRVPARPALPPPDAAPTRRHERDDLTRKRLGHPIERRHSDENSHGPDVA